jgi:hypothetical protein
MSFSDLAVMSNRILEISKIDRRTYKKVIDDAPPARAGRKALAERVSGTITRG